MAVDRFLDSAPYRYLGSSHAPAAPKLRLAVLTCMDARIDVFRLLGLQPGDAHVLRNAGGRVTEDVIRSLAISQAVLETEEVLVIHHTDCGISQRSEAEISTSIEHATGAVPTFPLLSFSDDDEALRDDMRQLRETPYLKRGVVVRGCVYDLAGGRLQEVV